MEPICRVTTRKPIISRPCISRKRFVKNLVKLFIIREGFPRTRLELSACPVWEDLPFLGGMPPLKSSPNEVKEGGLHTPPHS